jgi:KUP system potassium uptake protein
MAAGVPALALTLVFAVIDVGFFVSNIVKVFDGGWASLVVALSVVLVMITWRARLAAAVREDPQERDSARFPGCAAWPRSRRSCVPGTAVFLTSDPQSAPTAMMHSLKHYKVLHEQNVILTVVTAPHAFRVRMTTG